MAETKSTPHQNDQSDHSRLAYKGIRRMLYHKEIVPGQKIATREVAEKLQMSPTPIIQALKWLEFQGFVRHEPNRGYFMEPFSLQEIEEIYELRELIEPALLSATITRLDEAGITTLSYALEAHRSMGPENYLINERLFKNREFHLTLAGLSGKRTHMRLLGNILDLLFLKYGGNYFPVDSKSSTDEAHQRTYECVLARDASGARAALSQHISCVKQQVLEGFRKILEHNEEPEL